ncbi:hypothetical protein NM688_g9360 [Phlebia brevispora]|uniref:Uncharacterized protein n=1 Tax=Phlebia brevispora TaxID=194682 RepID=A0ACC1RGN2_9APHY|nr:hypothetical protein NM688_g9360 [Phlebia brevispora]
MLVDVEYLAEQSMRSGIRERIYEDDSVKDGSDDNLCHTCELPVQTVQRDMALSSENKLKVNISIIRVLPFTVINL